MRDSDMTRRSWLKAAAATSGATLLAGCGGGGGGGGDGAQTERNVPEGPVEKTFVSTEFNTIHNNNFNPFDSLYWPNQSIYYLFNPLFWESQKTQERLPRLGTSWSRDGDVLTIELDDRYVWHNGDPVTADDVVARLTLDLLAERRNWERAFADCYTDGEHTVVIELVEDANDDIAEGFSYMVGGNLVATHPDVYSDFLPDDGSRGAGAYDSYESFELTTMKGELLGYTVTSPPDEENPSTAPVIGNGPWKLVERGQREMVFEPFEDHPLHDEINFTKVKFVEYTTNQARYQALLGGNFSGLDLVLTQTVMDQLADYYEFYRYKRRLGHGLAMNYKRFPDHRVRQAIAFAIDKPEVVANSGIAESLVDPHSNDSALYASQERHAEVYGEGFVDQLTQYEQDTERAAALLEEVGWQRDDGQWYDENDEKVEVTIKTPPTWTEFVNMIQTEVQHLKDFGIDAQFETEELVVYYGQTMIQVDYDMAHWWVGGASDTPWGAYDTIWNALQTVADDHNHPAEYEVPGPIGEHNGDDTFTIDVQEYLDRIASSRTGTEEIRELHRELAWTYNQMLPVYCMNEVTGLASLDGRNWAAPSPDSENGSVFFPLSQFANRGTLKATDY